MGPFATKLHKSQTSRKEWASEPLALTYYAKGNSVFGKFSYDFMCGMERFSENDKNIREIIYDDNMIRFYSTSILYCKMECILLLQVLVHFF